MAPGKRLSGPGHYASLALWAVLFFAPVLMSVFWTSIQLNYFHGLLSAIVAIGVFPLLVIFGREKAVRTTKSGRILLGLLLFYLVAWMVTGTPAPVIDRFYLLVGCTGLYLLLLVIYENMGAAAVPVFSAKLLVTLATAIFFIIFVVFYQVPEFKFWVKGHPPVYRHLRHLNYDLFFALPVAILLLSRYPKNLLMIGCLQMLMMVAIWTAGRGMAVGLLASAVVLGLRIWRRPPLEQLLTVVVVFLASLVIVIASGNDYFLDRTTLQTFEGASLNHISSNRLAIWERSLHSFAAMETFGAKLVGFGPDAFVRLGVWPGNIVQPHSAPVQVLLEFGILGLLIFGILALIWLRRSIWLVLNAASDVDVLAGCLLVGGLVFSLVDGIFYHATSLTMMVVVISFVNYRFSKLRVPREL